MGGLVNSIGNEALNAFCQCFLFSSDAYNIAPLYIIIFHSNINIKLQSIHTNVQIYIMKLSKSTMNVCNTMIASYLNDRKKPFLFFAIILPISNRIYMLFIKNILH